MAPYNYKNKIHTCTNPLHIKTIVSEHSSRDPLNSGVSGWDGIKLY